MKNINALFKG